MHLFKGLHILFLKLNLNYPCEIPICFLSVLQRPLFETIQGLLLVLLTRKVVYLVTITSAKRVSELVALSCRGPFLVLHRDKVIIHPHSSFLQKAVSLFYLKSRHCLAFPFSVASVIRGQGPSHIKCGMGYKGVFEITCHS